MRHVRKRLIPFALLFILLATACGSLYPGDRMWISDEMYEQARGVYDTTGSLDLTEKGLRENPIWLRPEINEAIYRLKKQYRLQ